SHVCQTWAGSTTWSSTLTIFGKSMLGIPLAWRLRWDVILEPALERASLAEHATEHVDDDGEDHRARRDVWARRRNGYRLRSPDPRCLVPNDSFFLSGELDLRRADQLEAGLLAHAESTPGDTVVIDCSELTFIDSSGLGMLVDVHN